MSKMTPALKNHPALKRLSFRRNDQAIVFAPCVPVRVTPVKFKRLEFQGVERKKQVLAPLVTIAAFPPAVKDEEVVKNRRTKHPILLPYPSHRGKGALCHERRFVWIHS